MSQKLFSFTTFVPLLRHISPLLEVIDWLRKVLRLWAFKQFVQFSKFLQVSPFQNANLRALRAECHFFWDFRMDSHPRYSGHFFFLHQIVGLHSTLVWTLPKWTAIWISTELHMAMNCVTSFSKFPIWSLGWKLSIKTVHFSSCHMFDDRKLYDSHLEQKDAAYDLIIRMVTMITNFARTGCVPKPHYIWTACMNQSKF